MQGVLSPQRAVARRAVGGAARTGARDVRAGLGNRRLGRLIRDEPVLARRVLSRAPLPGAGCTRLLGERVTNAARSRTGPRVREDSVQAFLAEELEVTGDVERELPVPGGSATPWRTDGRDDTVIDPQVIGARGKGSVDIAYHPYSSHLEFLEVKEAGWDTLPFAEQQLANYLTKGNEQLGTIRQTWRRRGHALAYFDGIYAMPESRYTPPPSGLVDIDGRQVALAWCGEGVILFKTLDTENDDLHYCGVSDKGRTDAFLDQLMDPALDAATRALARQMTAIGLGEVNVALLRKEVEKRLRKTIRWFIQDTMEAVCAGALELSLAAVLKAVEARLRTLEIRKLLLDKFTTPGDGIELPIGQAAGRTAAVLTLGLVLDTLLGLAALAL